MVDRRWIDDDGMNTKTGQPAHSGIYEGNTNKEPPRSSGYIESFGKLDDGFTGFGGQGN